MDMILPMLAIRLKSNANGFKSDSFPHFVALSADPDLPSDFVHPRACLQAREADKEQK